MHTLTVWDDGKQLAIIGAWTGGLASVQDAILDRAFDYGSNVNGSHEIYLDSADGRIYAVGMQDGGAWGLLDVTDDQ